MRPSTTDAGPARLLIALVALATSTTALAQAQPSTAEMKQLRKQIAEQVRQIERLRQDLARQQQELTRIRQQVEAASGGAATTPTATAASPAAPAVTAVASPARETEPLASGAAAGAVAGATAGVVTAQSAQPAAPQPAAPPPAVPSGPVGAAPVQTAKADDGYVAPPAVAPLAEGPGVLTPKGKWVLEPSFQYAYGSNNRVALVGYTVIPAILIGLIDIREVKRNTMVAAFTARRGITNRFEMEARVPYVYRFDSAVSREVFTGSSVDTVFNNDGKGLGDIEVAGRYQFNNGGVDKPFYIGSLRFKSTTGKDPFEVETNRTLPGGRGTGLQTELPTGTGFYSLQPSLTVLFPSDPAVFFANFSYQHSFKRSNVHAKTDTGEEDLGSLQPGGVFEFGFGMGLSINERASFSVGYDQQSVSPLKQNGSNAPTSVRVQVARLLLGYSYRLDNVRTLNLSLGAGLTSDSPDLELTVRVPFTF
ncbi:MAG TPA: acetate kinase [Rhodocyclaceae bacterium]|nr:acetate kinase [Rhodocyclaceae bacterium]